MFSYIDSFFGASQDFDPRGFVSKINLASLSYSRLNKTFNVHFMFSLNKSFFLLSVTYSVERFLMWSDTKKFCFGIKSKINSAYSDIKESEKMEKKYKNR